MQPGFPTPASALLFLAVAVGLALYRRDDHRCLPFPPLDSTATITTTTCDLFSTSYHQARQRFRQACPTETVALTILPGGGGDDDDYTTDICFVQGTAPGVVLHLSGTHGIEGYAGSAIQLAYLLTQQQQQESHPTLVLVHAVNPHGMAHFRRTNENNVDLNRNGLNTTEWNIVQGALREKNVEASSSSPLARTVQEQKKSRRDLQLFFRPPVIWQSYSFSSFVSWGTSILALALYGQPRLKRSMVAGQYHDPTDVFYGGHKHPEPSLLLLRNWLESSTAQVSADGAVWTVVDVHTGLGRKGEDTLLLGPHSGDPQTVCDWFRGSECVSEQAGSVSSGYEGVRGFTMDYLLEHTVAATNDLPHLAVTQEFGTIPAVLVGNSLVVENAGRQAGLEWGRQTTLRSFYPADADWRSKVLKNGLRLFRQAMDRSINLSATARSVDS